MQHNQTQLTAKDSGTKVKARKTVIPKLGCRPDRGFVPINGANRTQQSRGSSQKTKILAYMSPSYIDHTSACNTQKSVCEQGPFFKITPHIAAIAAQPLPCCLKDSCMLLLLLALLLLLGPPLLTPPLLPPSCPPPTRASAAGTGTPRRLRSTWCHPPAPPAPSAAHQGEAGSEFGYARDVRQKYKAEGQECSIECQPSI